MKAGRLVLWQCRSGPALGNRSYGRAAERLGGAAPEHRKLSFCPVGFWESDAGFAPSHSPALILEGYHPPLEGHMARLVESRGTEIEDQSFRMGVVL
ncbi:hypothetical protein GJAV_G00003590 [Gymnothorax javanicus]|nr:hypothetical protein GJAV_G00003590 [Gymnothorax javanicus]